MNTLDISNNQIIALPAEIGKLYKLKVFQFGGNLKIDIPKEISELKNLIKIDLNSSELTSIPEVLFDLANLKEFYLRNNNLTVLPSDIGRLDKLRILDLDNNFLSQLPDELFNLVGLEELFLRNNNLMSLAGEIGNLQHLNGLYLSLNKIKTMPYQIGDLKNLAELAINGNPLEIPSLEIVNQGVSKIKEYLRALKTEGYKGKEVYEAKMLLLGDTFVGKTSLAIRLIDNDFFEKLSPTDGIEIRKFKLQSPTQNNIGMYLHLWDFGGDEIYHYAHQFFLTKRSLYLLILDARLSEQKWRIDYWLNIIVSFAPESPIIIVINKIDIRSLPLNMEDFKNQFPKIVDGNSYAVSCKDKTGLPILMDIIKREAWNLPLMGNFWIASWLKVREILENDSRNYITLREYLDICKKNKVDEDKAIILIQNLHDLGIILYYENIDVIVLKPEWCTKAFYSLLESKLAIEKHGFIHNSDLPKIWHNQDLFKRDVHATLMRLMNKAELAFPIDNDGSQYIIPELLAFKEPKCYWKYGDNAILEYHYNFLPAGIIPQFIVKLKEYISIEDEKYIGWRTGVTIQANDAAALLRINQSVNNVCRMAMSKNNFL